MNEARTDEYRFEVADDGVATLTLDRPHKKNALTFELYRTLTDHLRDLDRDDRVRVLVLRGEGGEFSSGGDVREIIAPLLDYSAEALFAFTRMTCDLVENLRRLSKPIVAAIDGVAVGAGSVIALASDVRILSERARFGFVFVRVGLCGADMGAAHLLPKIVGFGRATELLMTGDLIDAAEAYRIGLANRVVPAAELDAAATAFARKLARGPKMGLAMTKQALNDEMAMDLRAALEAEARTQALCMVSRDFREGHDAFVERRAPDFARARGEG